ncbi:hypothetical protein CBS63078_7910 [Aspergillus niger]|nr:hypothetical protein CBS63078_7910 [Aspergillus niger]KAI2950375.1 hypothetical protein CBS147323_10699 [Aspergillus niger]KAI3016964.1 hypothetical protein CBS147347_10547 [Aspergillus niger]KAI3084303.1 hypothetical protein CBS147353_1854 [Aspergillus niger]
MQPITPAPRRLDTSDPSSTPNASVPRLRKASTACRECKRTKARCQIREGTSECDRCTERHLSCVFDLEEDMPRKLAHKRKIEKLEEERNDLLQLIKTLQNSSDAKAMQVLNLIRSKTPLSKIKLYIDKNISEPERETAPSLAEIYNQTSMLENGNKRTYSHRALTIQRLVDIPVYRIPAAPWTSVTESDDFVSHLISLWLTWSYPFYNWIDRELFLRDAQEGKLNSQFCSPFLVNCILAEACFHFDYPEAYADPNNPDSRGIHFYEEARKLYEKIEGRLDMPTIQGCGVLFVCMAIMGKDRMGWWYLGQVRSMAEEYAKKHPNSPSDTPTRESRAIDNTIWGIYNLTATASISLMKHMAIDRPNRHLLPCDHFEDDTWAAYPRQVDTVQSHIPCVLNSFTALSALEKTLEAIQARLDGWRNDLPTCLTLDNATIPQSLSLHMLYHTVVIVLWGLLKKEDTEDENNIKITREAAKKACVDSALAIVNLLRIHRTRWGPDHISPTTIHWVSMALFTLVEELDNSEHRNAFTELCVTARAFSQKWTLMKGILRMLQVSAQKNGFILPPETRALFADFQKMWDEGLRDQFRSLYPNLSSLSETGGDRTLDEAELDSFLKKWDRLEGFE